MVTAKNHSNSNFKSKWLIQTVCGGLLGGVSSLLQWFGFRPLRFQFKLVTENWIDLPGGLTDLPQRFEFTPLRFGFILIPSMSPNFF
jgi:hypothetical protein